MEPRRCTGTSKQSGERCKRPPAKGLDKCSIHAGLSKAKRKVAAAESRLRQDLARLDVAPVDNPLEEIARVAAQVLWFKDRVAERVNELTSIRYSTDGGEQLRAEVALFERSLDRCEKFLTAMARLNIDERLARISEQQADLVTFAVTAALEELGLSPDQQTEARRHVARHLRAVPGS
jgi:hypothetical protein